DGREIDARQQWCGVVVETHEEISGAESCLFRGAAGLDALDEESGLVREPDGRSRASGEVRGGDGEAERARGAFVLEGDEELAQERGELAALLRVQRGEQEVFVGEVDGGDAVEQVLALLGERYQYSSGVVAAGDARDDVLALE